MRNKRTKFIYAVYSPESKLVKIGYSEAPSQRLAILQNSHGHRLVLLAHYTAPGFSAQVAERQFHRRLAAHRALGEWFHETPEVMAVVDEMRAAQKHEEGRRGSELSADGPPGPTICPWCGHLKQPVAEAS